MEVARTSMIHAAALIFLWPFAVQYATHQLNLWPRVSLSETSPTLRWTGEVGDELVFWVWGCRAFVRDASADKLSSRAVPCVFLGFPPDASGWQFYHPTTRRVFPSQDVTFDASVPFYRLFPYRTAPLPPSPLFLALGPPPVDPLPPQDRAPSGVSQVDPLPLVEPVKVTCDSGAAGGAEPAGAEPWGAERERAEPGGAEPERAELGGAEPAGAEPECVEPGGAEPKRVLLLHYEILSHRSSRASGTLSSSAFGVSLLEREALEILVLEVLELPELMVLLVLVVLQVLVLEVLVLEVLEVLSRRGSYASGTLSAAAFGMALLKLEALRLEPLELEVPEELALLVVEVLVLEVLELPGLVVLLVLELLVVLALPVPEVLVLGVLGLLVLETLELEALGLAALELELLVLEVLVLEVLELLELVVLQVLELLVPVVLILKVLEQLGLVVLLVLEILELLGLAAGGAGAAATHTGDAGAGGPGAGGITQRRVLFAPPSPSSLPPPNSVLRQVLSIPSSTGSPLPARSPYPEKTHSLTERREPASCPASPVRPVCIGHRVPCLRPHPVPGTHQMALRPSSVPLHVPLLSPPTSSLADEPDPESNLIPAASPTVTRLLATVVTDPSFESTTASAFVAELVDFAAACRLVYAASLVAESEQEDFECFAAAVPHLVSMLIAPEGDPDAPDIPTPRFYAEAIEGPYSSQWQSSMDVEIVRTL
ncbi:unnamed protein product [Closterium sp. NIES-65]|nr:unnamed protein product [Closterium sp. NIES-65]